MFCFSRQDHIAHSSLPNMLEEDKDETCWNNLENFRVKLISVIDPSRITPYLRQCKVISHDDEEQVLNDPSLVMRKRKAGESSAAFGSMDQQGNIKCPSESCSLQPL